MSKTVLSVLTCVVLMGCGDPGTDPDLDLDDSGTDDTDDTDDPAPEADLDLLLAASHTAIPLTLLPSHHLTVSVDSPVGPLRFLVDSGASTTVITQQLAAELGVSGALGAPVTVLGLSVGPASIGFPVVILDLDGTNAQFVAGGEAPIDGILGAPFLNGSQAVLSYTGPTLFVAEDPVPQSLAGEIGDALDGAGYDTIDAAINLIQFVELDAAIDGSARLNAIVDTGAGGTLVELAAANRLGLELLDAQTGAATIGGAVETYQTTVSELDLGDHLVFDRTLLVLDLGDINGQLSGAGLEPIDVIVGADLMEEQSGVLDYVGGRLFLY